ncbi:MAG: RsmD family RNA methyltransferase [bacterium]|nr:RsmD family RNA methyltransferase [bacterium]
MRIIAGIYKGYQFKTYNGINTRPTTDLAKESLFNALQNIYPIEACKVLDLFAGTGNIGLEFLSRGAQSLISIDMNYGNIEFMKKIKKDLQIKDWQITKWDAIKFIKQLTIIPDIVFADPPYDSVQLHELVDTVTKSDWFEEKKSLFILEHSDKLIFDSEALFLKKQYGSTCFSFFKMNG